MFLINNNKKNNQLYKYTSKTFFKEVTVLAKRKRASVRLNAKIYVLPISFFRNLKHETKKYIDNTQFLFLINNKTFNDYFINFNNYSREILLSLSCVKIPKRFKINFNIKIKGGGLRGQINCILLAISKALNFLLKFVSVKDRLSLKRNLFFRLDPRKTERKKYGLKKARKAPQYHKR